MHISVNESNDDFICISISPCMIFYSILSRTHPHPMEGRCSQCFNRYDQTPIENVSIRTNTEFMYLPETEQ